MVAKAQISLIPSYFSMVLMFHCLIYYLLAVNTEVLLRTDMLQGKLRGILHSNSSHSACPAPLYDHGALPFVVSVVTITPRASRPSLSMVSDCFMLPGCYNPARKESLDETHPFRFSKASNHSFEGAHQPLGAPMSSSTSSLV